MRMLSGLVVAACAGLVATIAGVPLIWSVLQFLRTPSRSDCDPTFGAAIFLSPVVGGVAFVAAAGWWLMPRVRSRAPAYRVETVRREPPQEPRP
jgi:hypothetical protein